MDPNANKEMLIWTFLEKLTCYYTTYCPCLDVFGRLPSCLVAASFLFCVSIRLFGGMPHSSEELLTLLSSDPYFTKKENRQL